MSAPNRMIEKYPLAERFVRRMEIDDPFYGIQQHQEQGIEWRHDMQRLQPCPYDHEHTHSCYSKETQDRTRLAQRSRRET